MESSFEPRLAGALLAVASAVGMGCSASSQAGVTVELLADAGEVGQWWTAPEGERLRVDTVSWVVSEVELEPCVGMGARIFRWLVPSAHAHGTSTPTKSAVPALVSTSLAQPVVVGQLAPPAMRYCGIRYRIAPADADTVGLATEPTMLGRSLRLVAELSGEPERERLTLSTEAAIDVERAIDVELSADRAQVRIQLACAPERWLEALGGIEGLRDEVRASALLEAFGAALSVSVE